MISNHFDLENISTPNEGAPLFVLPCLGNPLSPRMQIFGEKLT